MKKETKKRLNEIAAALAGGIHQTREALKLRDGESMSLKMTAIEMEWTDTGAKILSTVPIPCPVCGVDVQPNEQHLCGEFAVKPKRKGA